MLAKIQVYQLWRTALLPVIDFLAISIAAWVIYFTRYNWLEFLFIAPQNITALQYFFSTILFSLLIIFVLAFLGSYNLSYKASRLQAFSKILAGVWLVLLTLISFLFFNEYNQTALPEGVVISRFILAVAGFFIVIFIILLRLIYITIFNITSGLNKNLKQVAIINNISEVNKSASSFSQVNKLATYLQGQKQLKLALNTRLSAKAIQKTKALITNHELQQVFLFSSGSSSKQELELANICERYKVKLSFLPSEFNYFSAVNFNYETWGSQPFFALNHSQLSGWGIIAKRLLDISFSFSFLVAFSWLYIAIAIAIRLESKGGVIYASERVAPNGKIFLAYKFRRFWSQYCTSEVATKAGDDTAAKALEYEQSLIKEQGQQANRGALYKIMDDPRMTKVGKFLERTSLDELPQMWNVLIGNMSLVGPRPHQPREVKKYALHHFKVLNIQPGVTGMAQVNGRSDLSFEEEVRFDTYYVQNWSWKLDLEILYKTIWVVLFKRHKA